MAFLDETGLAELWSLTKAYADKKARIVTGSYVGTGTEGSSNPMSVTFSFKPKLFMIPNRVHASDGQIAKNQIYSYAGCPMLMVDAAPTDGKWSYKGTNDENALGYCTAVKYDDTTNTLSWYSSEGATQQWNASGDTYYWIAIG